MIIFQQNYSSYAGTFLKGFVLSGFLIFMHPSIFAQNTFDNYPVYTGADLGLQYSKKASSFKIWSPPAQEVNLQLYKHDLNGEAYKTLPLISGEEGTWFIKVKEDLQGIYYTFTAKINGTWSAPTADPYAKACGTNGVRAMVTDLKLTNPTGWKKDKSPAFSDKNLSTDAVISEWHVRDISIAANSGITHKGKYLGLAEEGSKDGETATGLSHLKEMGFTHIHLLPFFDFNSVDESTPEKNHYNWGYDPLHYNIPEGSYSTDPANGITRIKELKTMIGAMHKAGLRVVMDVVYNHTSKLQHTPFTLLVPGYYYRQKPDGSYSDASACGNETASERPMMRKFMIESLAYWVKEYHIDGFRFDLMGIHDVETMNAISKTLHDIKPDILLYGEGWAAGASPLPEIKRALKHNEPMLDRIAVFSDDIRDGIKGSVFSHTDKGFAMGNVKDKASVEYGIVAAGLHPQIPYKEVNYDKEPFTLSPAGVINYASCHDNHTLWDKIQLAAPEASEEDKKKMHKLALTIILTSQGIPFLHGGTEFYRTKHGAENSYNLPDSINEVDWNAKKENLELIDYIKKLIAIRKAHPAFRMSTAEQVAGHIIFEDDTAAGVIAYRIRGELPGENWKEIWVGFNGTAEEKTAPAPTGKWQNALEQTAIGIIDGHVILPKYSSLILFR